ncbi:protein of unknown function [Paenibacillus alvei]|uniref:Uncharacterized protein n=1 Tax=Paenibacillus alvei TaxID=44250 RepID=A0A383R913_PAEAL|nr:protein of unknown function [Paenibacillus alvei]
MDYLLMIIRFGWVFSFTMGKKREMVMFQLLMFMQTMRLLFTFLGVTNLSQ